MNRISHRIATLALFTLSLGPVLRGAAPPKAPPQLDPDPRYKADILLIIAHPDDDVVIGGYLAKVALDDHKRVAVIYCTSGDGGGNAVGNEAGASLGQMRIIEARRALGFFGIDNVWFLGAHDTPGQDVLRSLDAWGHGYMLDQVVRLVRITRPEVIMTWMPNSVVGENHGDHQASGVLATEAFDTAGDPTQFPEQVSAARDRVGMANLTEGLHPWQPKKLYYFTDAFEDFGPYWHAQADLSPYRDNFLKGRGPTYPMTAISPSKHESYAKLTAQQQTYYMTQEGYLGTQALDSAGLNGFEYPVQLLFGKSVVGGEPTGDVFQNVGSGPAQFTRVGGYEPSVHKGLTLDLAGPWIYYQQFWKAHNIENIGRLIPVPELAVDYNQPLFVPILLTNDTPDRHDVLLTAQLPEGWSNQSAFTTYPVAPGQSYSVRAKLMAPKSGKPKWQEIQFKAASEGRQVGAIQLRVFTGKGGGLPQ